MENDTQYGMSKKYGCVKKSLIQLPEACTVSFAMEEEHYFLIIDSRKQRISINMANIDAFKENNKGNLVLIYYIPVQEPEKIFGKEVKRPWGKKPGEMQQEKSEFECCENEQLIKTYEGIQKKQILAESQQIEKQIEK